MEGLFGPDRLSEALRGKIREVILTLAEAELAEVLAAQRYERKGERRGYRNGKRERTVSTGLWASVIELPRARLKLRWGGEGVAESTHRALSAACSIGEQCRFGLLSQRSERAADPRGVESALARSAAI